MTIFNPENKKVMTFGDCLIPAMAITDADDAKQYFEAYVKYQSQFPSDSGKTPEEICKINLGYFAGYYSYEVQVRVEKLFFAMHPIFGSVKIGSLTPEQALQAGKDLANQ